MTTARSEPAHDGSVEAMELSDVDDLGPFVELEAELAELLAEDDVINLAAAMDPGSTAGVIAGQSPRPPSSGLR